MDTNEPTEPNMKTTPDRVLEQRIGLAELFASKLGDQPQAKAVVGEHTKRVESELERRRFTELG